MRKGAERPLKGVGLPLARTLSLATPSCVGGGPSRARVRQGGARLRGHDNAGIKKPPARFTARGVSHKRQVSTCRGGDLWPLGASAPMWTWSPLGGSEATRRNGLYKRRGPPPCGQGAVSDKQPVSTGCGRESVTKWSGHKKSPTRCLQQVGRESCSDLLSRARRPSTIGDRRLNFRVRNGNGCDPPSITAETYTAGRVRKGPKNEPFGKRRSDLRPRRWIRAAHAARN